MGVAAEKMREMRKALKEAGERLRTLARFPDDPAAFLRQKKDAIKERAQEWRARISERDAAGSVEAAPQSWDKAWDEQPLRSAAEITAIPDTSLPRERPAAPGWLERLSRWRRALRIAAIALLVFLLLPYVLILIYRVIDPPFSALMARQFLTGTSIRHQWVDFEDISPALAQAVVISEDAAFCRHWGVDWNAVGDALEDAGDGRGIRGASTIPMQTAKNLFLWNGQSVVRKALEVPLAYAMSAVWPKRRVLEVYLNIAEWGPGIFGAEAAARYHFGKPASQLSTREAALLAAALPNPITRRAGRPNGLTAQIAARIGARAQREVHDASCVFPRGR